MALDNGESIRAVFVDFAKAFDHVDHGLVVARLVEFGVPSYVIRWIYSFLKNRQQRVRIGKILSGWLTLNGGMLQGTWLGPIIFIILIDALKLQSLTHKFIYDTTLSEILRRDQSSGMNEVVKELVKWTEANKMKLKKWSWTARKRKKLSLVRCRRIHHPSLFWTTTLSKEWLLSSSWAYTSPPTWNGMLTSNSYVQKLFPDCTSSKLWGEHARTRETGLLLHDCHTSSFGICMSWVAFQSPKEAH